MDCLPERSLKIIIHLHLYLLLWGFVILINSIKNFFCDTFCALLDLLIATIKLLLIVLKHYSIIFKPYLLLLLYKVFYYGSLQHHITQNSVQSINMAVDSHMFTLTRLLIHTPGFNYIHSTLSQFNRIFSSLFWASFGFLMLTFCKTKSMLFVDLPDPCLFVYIVFELHVSCLLRLIKPLSPCTCVLIWFLTSSFCRPLFPSVPSTILIVCFVVPWERLLWF